MNDRDTIREIIQKLHPELWNTLALAGQTDEVVELCETAFDVGKTTGAVGGEPDETIEHALDRTLDVFATVYADFSMVQIDELTPGHNPVIPTIGGQLQIAQKLIVPKLLNALFRKFMERGLPLKPAEPTLILPVGAGEGEKKELILP